MISLFLFCSVSVICLNTPAYKEFQSKSSADIELRLICVVYLQLVAEDLSAFQTKQSNMLAKLDEYKRKHLELSHRLLQVCNYC